MKRDEINGKKEEERKKATETAKASKERKIDSKGNLQNPVEKRREMSASFNSVTRRKRDLTMNSGLDDKMPDPGHYYHEKKFADPP